MCATTSEVNQGYLLAYLYFLFPITYLTLVINLELPVYIFCICKHSFFIFIAFCALIAN